MAANGIELAKAYVQIVPSAEGLGTSLTAEIEKAGAQAGAAGGSAAGSSFSGALGKVAGVGAAALAGATAAVTEFASASVQTGMDFDAAMSQVAATMGYTKDELNDSSSEAAQNFGQLRDFAQEMGATTAFSATQAAEALNYMALAGYDSTVSMEMLPNVLNLAAAGDMALATASDMVTDAQSALGLSLEETADLVDIMAKTASSSNTSVSQMGDAILTVGGTAKTLAGGVNEMSTAIGILADSGIKGSEGGTHLRNVILSLSSPSDQAAALLEDLGVQTTDTGGNLLELSDIMSQLSGKIDNLGTASRAEIISTIFNKTDIASVNALLAAAGDEYAALSLAVEECGVSWDQYSQVQEMAASGQGDIVQGMRLMLEQYEGDVEQVASTIAEYYGMSYEDAMTAVNATAAAMEEFATSANRFDELSGKISSAWYTIGSLSDELANVGLDMGTMQTSLEQLGISAEDFNTVLDVSGQDAKLFADCLLEAADAGVSYDDIVNAIGGDLDVIQTAFDATSGAAQAMADTQLDNLAGDVTLFQSALEGAKIAVSDELTPTLREFVKFGSKGLSELTMAFQEDGLSGAMDAFGGLLSEGLTMIIDMLPEVINAGMELLGALAQGLLDNAPQILDAAVEIVMTLAQGLIDGYPVMIPKVVEVILQLVETLTSPENLGNLIDAALEIMLALMEGLIDAIPKLIEAAPKIIENLVTAIIALVPKIVETGVKLLIKLVEGIINTIPKLVEAAPKLITAFVNGIASYFVQLVESGKNIILKVKEGVSSIIANAKQWGIDLIQNFINGIVSMIQNVINTARNVAQSIKNILGFSEPEEGPLSNFHTYAPDMMRLFAQGIRENRGLVTHELESAFNFRPTIAAAYQDNMQGKLTGDVIRTGANAPQQVQNVTMILEIDGKTFARGTFPYYQAEQIRIGAHMKKGAVMA